ncbi:cellulose biosynthesis cyclic di-GMP-binding regulatory protein BcsB [Pseudoalteromonas sp. SG45-5]|uniref:cellulose biosynthesis cyclic di-GMP-binding regulatory protein BcsB n=2 Tax=Pseudoalteromonas TaxID=53246 RepID=UPI0015F9755D|nr:MULTISPECIES: cellulose biosynthesis cyclic di-GMP-binding regulatory protein BcsB [unclassified Pseudoalteromonas]MBB1384031.1 cellulose biosynthesis cyclic di-GMP-binding regulatory protein BcsB [Pseudoalteromonas sp. SG45-5]MBB1395080.1 cellulose biosynthesis cyclic di-GMP-binding regulatory protein BcsB [Pseudoalteromonas sp. SG44-4]
MIKKLLNTFLTLLLISCAQHAHAIEPMQNKSMFINGYPESAQISSLRLDFEALGFTGYKLDGVNNNSRVDFTNRIDKLSTNLKLNFSYTNSPSLIANVSHLKVYFNDNLVTVLPINEKLSVVKNTVSHNLELNAKYIQDYNQIRFELVGYYDLKCQDYFSRSIWTEINKSSNITLEQKQLAIDSRLEYLPEPFFDAKDYNKLNLPFVFSKVPNTQAIEAAATLSSWFGAQADWRGANFPVMINKAPKQHSVVFITNDSKPDFLKDYPDVEKPTVELISSPIHRYNKMLLIIGRDEKDLKTAVTGLVFGHKIMTGRTASIEAINQLPLRKAYDAPRWLRSDRPVHFDELIDYPTQLQTQGLNNGPVKLNIRFAPDLFTWREKGIPITLQYRNTPESETLDSRLNMLINQEFISGFLLDKKDTLLKTTQTLLPLIANTDTTQSTEGFSLNGINLANRNELNFDFRFAVLKKGECSVAPAGGEYGVIDGNSHIDVSGFDHYMALPDLNVFANSGFPFTKYADLQQTLVLIDETPSAKALSVLFNLTGHFGAITGYPAHRISVAHLNEDANLNDKDVLVIAKPNSLANNLDEGSHTNVLLSNNQRAIKQALYNGAYDEQTTQKVHVSIKSSGDIAVITGFQSPLDSERSIVSLSATSQNAYTLLNNALMNSAQLAQIKGSAAVINSQGIKTIKTDKQYFVGHIPVHTLIWFHLSDHPFVLALLSVLILLLISFILWRLLQALTYKRLAEGDK